MLRQRGPYFRWLAGVEGGRLSGRQDGNKRICVLHFQHPSITARSLTPHPSRPPLACPPPLIVIQVLLLLLLSFVCSSIVIIILVIFSIVIIIIIIRALDFFQNNVPPAWHVGIHLVYCDDYRRTPATEKPQKTSLVHETTPLNLGSTGPGRVLTASRGALQLVQARPRHEVLTS